MQSKKFKQLNTFTMQENTEDLMIWCIVTVFDCKQDVFHQPFIISNKGNRAEESK